MNPTLLRAWLLPLLCCVLLALLIGGIHRASLPSMAAVRSIEAAASQQQVGDALPAATANWQVYALPLRTCTVRCDTPFLLLRHRTDDIPVPAQTA